MALVVTIPNPKAAPLVWVFPFGLLRLAGSTFDSYVVNLAVGWLPYAALTTAAVLARRSSTYLTILGLCAWCSFSTLPGAT